MKNVLVTGFEPFGGESINPSALAAEALNGRTVAGRRVTGVVLPCVFGVSLDMLKREIRQTHPELVICTGLGQGSRAINVERVAVNLDDAVIPDNAGNQPIDREVIAGGPPAYFSKLPVKAIVAALRDEEIQATASFSAGTYVCNHVFYGLMHRLARKRGARGGFIHVPYLPERTRTGPPGMPLDTIVRGLEIAIETSLTLREDLHAVGAAIS